jgi:hypothetical protein
MWLTGFFRRCFRRHPDYHMPGLNGSDVVPSMRSIAM